MLTSYESGQAGQAVSDEDVLAFAVAEARILITLNRKHFVRLHQAHADYAGIVVCTFDPDFATDEFTVKVSLLGNRVLFGKAFERLEPCDGRLSRTVLRGRGGSNAFLLPGARRLIRELLSGTDHQKEEANDETHNDFHLTHNLHSNTNSS